MFSQWLRRFVSHHSNSGKRIYRSDGRRLRVRLLMERLEDRTVPTTHFVVPGNIAVDSLHFHDMTTALSGLGGLSRVTDVVQIEPNSIPGNATVSAKLIVQGDPSFGPQTLPQLGDLTIDADNVTLNNLNLSFVTINSTRSHAALTNSLVQDIRAGTGNGTGFLTLTGDTITRSAQITSLNSTAGATNDLVQNNVFTGGDAAMGAPQLLLVGADGSTIQNNTFIAASGVPRAIRVRDSQNVNVANNAINMTGGQNAGINLVSQDRSASMTVTNNTLNTPLNSGTGIDIQKSTTGFTLQATITGNDLVLNQVGILIEGDGTTLPTVDAGSNGGSLGGNDFHLFTSTSGGRGAIDTTSATLNPSNPVIQIVPAHLNTWSVADPSTVVSPASETGIDTTNPLNANQGFVQDLYRDFFKRTGGQDEINFWASQVANVGKSGVIQALRNSYEGLSRQVNDYYLKFLGRFTRTTDEEKAAVQQLQSGSEEQFIAGLLATPEFLSRAPNLVPFPATTPNASFIQSLYTMLLGRVADGGGLDFWVSQIPIGGRQGVALGFLQSVEFRKLMVTALYTPFYSYPPTSFVSIVPDLLHRSGTPADADLSFWANSNLDMRGLILALAGTDEFFTNG